MQVFKTFSLFFFWSSGSRLFIFLFFFQYHYYYFVKFLCASLTLMVKKSTVVSALINAQLTGRNSFSYQMVLEGNTPLPPPLHTHTHPPAPPGSDTPPAVPADSCEDGRILSRVRVTARCPWQSSVEHCTVSVTLLKVPYWKKKFASSVFEVPMKSLEI